MTETPQGPQQTGTAPRAGQVPPQTRGQEERTEVPSHYRGEAPAPEPTGWYGWVIFASMMMIMAGGFQATAGLVALFNSDLYVVSEDRLVVNVDFTTWGWTHLILGAVAVAAAFGLLVGQMWARIVGIVMALVSALVNLAFMSAYPLWSLTIIALDVLVIYAIAMHGAEGKATRHRAL